MEQKPKGGKALIIGGVGAGGTAAVSVTQPQFIMKFLQWLDGELGTVGFVCACGLGISVIANWLMWQRNIAKDRECREERELQEKRHLQDRENWRADIKECYASVAALAHQTTILVERSTPLKARRN